MAENNILFERTYRTAKLWRIFAYIACSAFIILFFGLLITTLFFENDYTPVAIVILIFISLAMIALGVFGLIDVVRSKLVITSERLYSTAEFSYRELLLNEVQGFHRNDRYIFIEPLPEVKKKRIKISKYYGNIDELIAWLYEHYPDIAEVEAKREAVEILTEADYGATPELRATRLKKAKRVARILNIGSIVASAWLLVYPYPLTLAVTAAILFPIVSMLVLKRFGGLIRIDKEDKSPYPSVFLALSIPPSILFLRALKAYSFVSVDSLWTLAGVVALLFTISIMSTMRKSEWKKAKNWWLSVATAIMMVLYGYSVVALINGIGDQSKAEIYPVQIIGKRVSTGKTTTYYLELEPWGPVKEEAETDVPGSLYDAVSEGDVVYVHLRQGLFNIPWYTVSRSSD